MGDPMDEGGAGRPQRTQPPRVVIVAIHGVADQKRGQSAAEVTTALIRDAGWTGGDPGEESVRIRPLPEGFRGAPSLRSRLDSYQEQRAPATWDVATRRLRHPLGVEASVFDMFWADLSRPSAGFLGIVSDLYTLVGHLPHLGLSALVAAELPPGLAGRLWRPLHQLATNLLSITHPVLNLMLLASLLLLWPASAEPPMAAGLLGIFAAVSVLALGYLLRRRLAGPPWILPVVVPPLLASAIYLLLRAEPAAVWILVLLIALAGVGGLAWFLWRFERSLWLARTTLVASIVGGLGAVLWRIADAGRWAFHPADFVMAFAIGLIGVLALSTALLYAASLGAWVCGAVCARGPEADSELRRLARWCGLLLPGGLAAFLLLTMGAWRALLLLCDRLLPSLTIHRWGPWWLLPGTEGPVAIPAIGDHILDLFATGALLPMGLAVIAAFAFVAWFAVPGVVADVEGAWRRWQGESTKGSADASEADLRAEARFVSAGLQTFRFWGPWLLQSALVLALAVLSLALWNPIAQWYGWPTIAEEAMGRLGGAERTVLSTVALLLGLSVATRVIKGPLQAVLDVMMDVDVWLREWPSPRTPAAVMLERTTGLLLHVARGGIGAEPPERIVIVAHSQGSLLITETLRALPLHPEWGQGPRPEVHLVTVGSPLRQLDATLAPSLFPWVAKSGTPAELPVVAQWSNLYGLLDYVGRQLWADEPAANPAWSVPSGPRAECSLGPIGHLAYFSPYGRRVAQEIDRLAREPGSARRAP